MRLDAALKTEDQRTISKFHTPSALTPPFLLTPQLQAFPDHCKAGIEEKAASMQKKGDTRK